MSSEPEKPHSALTSLAGDFITAAPAGEPLDAAVASAAALAADGANCFVRLAEALRRLARQAEGRGRLEELMDQVEGLAGAATEETLRRLDDMRVLLRQVMMALLIEQADYLQSAVMAAETLSLLAREPRRKDTPFLYVLGTTLYDLSLLHERRGEFKQAERCIEKALRVIDRLARLNPDVFATTRVWALDRATSITRDRDAQARLLERYQAETLMYMQQLSGSPDSAGGEAARRLVNSLSAEGETLARMGRHREAMQYFSRALKYLTRVETDFSLFQLRLSIALGEEMLYVATMRDKGVHLLNTMLHKASRLGAEAEHRRIVDVLYHAKSRTFDIMSVWHKMFPA